MSILRVIDLRGGGDLDTLIGPRRETDLSEAENVARGIVEAVRRHGDDALVEFTRRFDCPSFDAGDIRVQDDEVEAAYQAVDEGWLDAVRTATANVEAFHRRHVNDSWVESFGNLRLGVRITPLEVVGLYGPAGRAPLPSSVLMSAIPARVAGVSRLILCTPPRADGTAVPTMLVAAAEAGVTDAFKVGGAQAIAALAYGTETVPKCDKVVG
ncbi:MAG: histidinol dehydrogenase, partial [Armatimonadota bacterium]